MQLYIEIKLITQLNIFSFSRKYHWSCVHQYPCLHFVSVIFLWLFHKSKRFFTTMSSLAITKSLLEHLQLGEIGGGRGHYGRKYEFSWTSSYLERFHNCLYVISKWDPGCKATAWRRQRNKLYLKITNLFHLFLLDANLGPYNVPLVSR